MEIIINRISSTAIYTLSNNYVIENKKTIFKFKGIELPWKDNAKSISCIPSGIYKATAVRRSSNNKYALLIHDVPNRSEIMVHTANYVRDLRGCLAPGLNFYDLDKDGIIDVTSSQNTMDMIEELIPLGTETTYHVINTYELYGNEDYAK